jgi:very-short-patch-repair endonuclease
MKIYYNPKLKQKSRDLRKNSTPAEVLLWNQLKSKQMHRYQFMRQKPIGEYIVDFYCSKLKLVIEIDGISHNDKFEYDLDRQNYLESLGLAVIRFNDIYVKKNMQGVLNKINEYIDKFENS